MEMCKVTYSTNILSWIQQYLWKMGQPSALSVSQENCSWKHCIACKISEGLLFTSFKLVLLLQPATGLTRTPLLVQLGWLWQAAGQWQAAAAGGLALTSFPSSARCVVQYVSPSRGRQPVDQSAPPVGKSSLTALLHNFSTILGKLLGSRSFRRLFLQSLKLLLAIIHLNSFVIWVKISLCSSCSSEK